MTDKAPYYVGQPVIVTDRNLRGQPIHSTITKVGRTLVTIPIHRNDHKFRMDSRRINDDFGHQRFYTRQQWDERNLRISLDERLKAAKFQVGYSGISAIGERWTIDQVERLVALVEEVAANGS